MTETTLDPNARYVRASDVVSTDMNGEVVMMHIEKGSYFSLTGTGGPIWDRLEQPLSFAELRDSLASEFDFDDSDANEGLVAEFLAKLIAEGLVVPAD